MDPRQQAVLSPIHGMLWSIDGLGRFFRRNFLSECRCMQSVRPGLCPWPFTELKNVTPPARRTEWETGNEAAARCAQPPSFCPYALFLSRIIKKLYMIDTQNRIEECEILDNDLATFKTLWSTAVYFIASNNSFVHARMHFLSHRIKSLRIFYGFCCCPILETVSSLMSASSFRKRHKQRKAHDDHNVISDIAIVVGTSFL